MEFYFQQPSTKYHWQDFQKKVFLRDQAHELRRKMIIRNIHNTSKAEFIELKHVCLHMNAVVASKTFDSRAFGQLLDFFKCLKSYLQDYFFYQKLKAQRTQGRRFLI